MMAASITENLKKIDMLAQRMEEVLKQYGRLARQHQALPIQTRRDLSLPFPRERFYLTAILEHRLSSLAFNIRDNIPTTKDEPTTGTTEIRPAWPGYYNEHVAYEQSRAAWEKAGVPDNKLSVLEGLVGTMEEKLQHVTTAADRISTCPIKSARPLTTILQTWTNFCMNVYLNHIVDQAFMDTDIYAFHATPMSNFTGPGSRKWFIFNQVDGSILSDNRRATNEFPHGAASPLVSNAQNFQPRPSRNERTKQQQHSPTKAAAIDRFQRYNDHWERLGPKAQVFCLPSYDFQLSGLRDVRHTTAAHFTTRNWTAEEIMIVNAKVFFCRGFDAAFVFGGGANGKLTFTLDVLDKEKISRLQRHLKLVENVRWHPDKMNARTGMGGSIDQTLGSRDFVVAIRAAVQELTGECGRAVQ